MDMFLPGFRFILIAAAGFGAMLMIGSIFYLGIVAPMLRATMYLSLFDLGQSEQAEILGLRRALSLKPRYLVRYRYRVLQNDGTLKTFTRSEKIDQQLFAALHEFYQRSVPVPIRYLAEKPAVAQLEMRMEQSAADFAALRTARPRRRRWRNSVRSYLLIALFFIISALVNAYSSDINQFLDSLVP